MKIYKNFSLKKYNSFGVEVKTLWFIECKSICDIDAILKDERFKNIPVFILGNGNNILFTKDFNGLIIKIKIKEKKIFKENKKYVWLEVGAGEDWMKSLKYIIDNNWGGAENLAHIPSSLGGAVVQNMSAYGHNFRDIVDVVETIEIKSFCKKKFNNKECKFRYHGSIFNKEEKNKYIITKVILKLNKKPKLSLNYSSRHSNKDALLKELKTVSGKPYTIKDIYRAVTNIRKRKLPNFNTQGTVGSVFLNPIISQKQLNDLKKKIPDLQIYPANDTLYVSKNKESELIEKSNQVKVAGAWLLDEIGWAGKKIGHCYTPSNQAYFLCTDKKASGQEILKVIKKMQRDFKKVYGFELEHEVVIM
ncbi:UDP-N-acetylmuramate dehydrogenase [Patescibacteria group bacterium]|nr:UDP-N-acetylmuramate dehydrogenase [Patescibacteria group bacterium]MBU1519428.1 UDP-N-acetylmuramate dehydrogenase [Patescibacteria group bacterium]MBU2416782.1 UDP-N-acetylmuramate dehydrogenase [Patescibacteria group bacterium]MBU2460825.1 UDP-N-acetylmuramate dehydrogenase [Patescibacteria group bacterium]